MCVSDTRLVPKIKAAHRTRCRDKTNEQEAWTGISQSIPVANKHVSRRSTLLVRGTQMKITEDALDRHPQAWLRKRSTRRVHQNGAQVLWECKSFLPPGKTIGRFLKDRSILGVNSTPMYFTQVMSTENIYGNLFRNRKNSDVDQQGADKPTAIYHPGKHSTWLNLPDITLAERRQTKEYIRKMPFNWSVKANKCRGDRN